MTNEELIQLYRETKDNELIEQIIKQNRKLIFYVIKRYAVDEVEKEDLFQEGSIGLLKAIGKFDSSMNYKFSTYAIWHIRAYMSRYIDQKIKKHLEVDSLNKTIGEEQDIEVQDLIQDEDINIEELIKDKLYKHELEEVIQAYCSNLEQKAIHLYYYLNLTHSQVQKVLQLSTQGKAQRLIERGLRNIRRSPWGAREYKEIKERRIDSRTKWVNNQMYDSIANSNSHRDFYSSVEDLVLKRERMRMIL